MINHQDIHERPHNLFHMLSKARPPTQPWASCLLALCAPGHEWLHLGSWMSAPWPAVLLVNMGSSMSMGTFPRSLGESKGQPSWRTSAQFCDSLWLLSSPSLCTGCSWDLKVPFHPLLLATCPQLTHGRRLPESSGLAAGQDGQREIQGRFHT